MLKIFRDFCIRDFDVRDFCFRDYDAIHFNKYREARNDFLPVHTIDIKRWAIECYYANKVNNSFIFKASDGWLYSFKKRHRIVSRKAIKIICLKEVQNQDKIQESINTFKDLYHENKSKYTDRYTWLILLVITNL